VTILHGESGGDIDWEELFGNLENITNQGVVGTWP